MTSTTAAAAATTTAAWRPLVGVWHGIVREIGHVDRVGAYEDVMADMACSHIIAREVSAQLAQIEASAGHRPVSDRTASATCAALKAEKSIAT